MSTESLRFNVAIAVNRFFKCPTLGQRFSDKFPTAGTDQITNTQQMPGWGGGGRGRGIGTLGIDRAINSRLTNIDIH